MTPNLKQGQIYPPRCLARRRDVGGSATKTDVNRRGLKLSVRRARSEREKREKWGERLDSTQRPKTVGNDEDDGCQ